MQVKATKLGSADTIRRLEQELSLPLSTGMMITDLGILAYICVHKRKPGG